MTAAERDRQTAEALLSLRRHDAALDSATAAAAAEPDHGGTHRLLARIHLAMGALDDAIDEAQVALRLEPDVRSLHVAAQVRRARGEFGASLELIDRALDEAPESPHLHIGRALALVGPTLDASESTSQPDKADEPRHLLDGRAAAERAVAIDPELATARYAMGLCALAEQDLPGAARSLIEALELAPDWQEAHLLLGHVRSKQGMAKLASRHYAAAGALDPGADEPLRRLRALGGVRRRRLRRHRTAGPMIDFLVPEAQRILDADLRMGDDR